MKKIYLLLIALAVYSTGFGQTEILNQPFSSGSLPSGWTQTDVTFTTSSGGYANFLTVNALLTSPTFDASSYTSVRVDFDVAKFGTGTDGPLRLEYSLNGGTTWILAANSTTPTDANYQSNAITINAVSSTMRIRFNRAPSPSQKRLRNVVVFGIGSGCTAPTTQVTNYTTTTITSTSATLNWTRGSGDNVLVVIRAGSAVTTNPTNGTSYTANPAFGSGAQIGTGNYVVYNGTASSVNVTGLSQGNTYHVAIYEYNNTGICYKTPALTGNFNIPCPTFSLPFTEGFESATFPPTCWTSFRGLNNTGTSFDWSRSSTARTGTGAAFVRWESNGNTNEDWLVTPPIALTGSATNTLTYWNRGDNFSGSTFTVRISTTSATDRASYTTLLTYASPLATTYAQRTVNLSAYSGSTVYVAFVMTNNNGDSWYIDDVSVTSSPLGGSTSSNIVDNTFTPTADINYLAYAATSGLTTSNAIKIGEFRIQDGGNASPDADALSTTLTSLGLTVQNFGDLQALAIFDGTTNVREVTSVTATTTFNTLNLTAPDNGSKVFSVYATFKPNVTDNNQIRLTVATATANASGSLFAATNAGGAQTSITGDANRIEVTATALAFVQQPTNTIVNEAMAPAPTLRAIDANLNRDLDYVSSVTLSTTGTFAGTATTSATAVAGIATFNNLIFSSPGTGLTLSTVSGLTNAVSTTFNITTAGWQISNVNQAYTIDFDTSVANVNNGTYTGAGFTPNPSAGQLNSGAWASTGMSDGDLVFGGTRTTGDYARGVSTGEVSTGGFYAFEVATGNRAFGIQPTGSDYISGSTTLRAQNQTGQTVTSITFAYTVYVNNNENRDNTFNFSYSTNNTTYYDVPSLDITSGTTGNSAGFVAVTRTITVNALNIADGAYVYLRWSTDNPGGSGSMDEFGLDDINVVFNPVITSNESNIVETSFDEPDNINYSAFITPNGLTTVNAIKIGEFSIQDGGDDLTDADNFPTILTDLSFTVANFENIAALALFDGATNVSEVTTLDTTTTFNGLNLQAADNSSKIISVYASFKSIVTDNDQLQLSINSATTPLTNSSGFVAADAGGASTSTAGDDNRIEVTATVLSFVQQPSDVDLNSVMAPAVTVSASDAIGNTDADFAGTVTLTTTGSFSGAATTSASAISGLATFTNLVFNDAGSFTLTASAAGLPDSAPSNSFEVSPASSSFWIEPFTDNSQYAVTLGAEGSNGDDNYLQITDGSNIDVSYTGNTGNFFAGQDINDTGWAGSASPSQLVWTGIDISRYTSLEFSGKFASRGGGIDDDDYAIVEYQIDGGGWLPLIAFENDGSPFNTAFREVTGTPVSPYGGNGDGIQLNSTFQNFTKSIPGSGARLDLRITIAIDAGNEDLALEDFKLDGLGTVFYGNGQAGFGGVLGNGSLEISAASGSTIDFVYNRGTDNFNDYLVIYIDSKPGGISNTALLTDTGDPGRKAISGLDGSNRSLLTFPPGFMPDYALSISNGFAGLFEIRENAAHTFIQSASLSPTGINNSASYSFNISFASIMTTPGEESFKFLATYINGNNAFRSNESIGLIDIGSNPGYTPTTFETYFQVTNGLQGGIAPTVDDGLWSTNGTWRNGNAPLLTDFIIINNAVNQDINVTPVSVVINGALNILPDYTLTILNGITGTGSFNVEGTFEITEGGFTNISPTYSDGATLAYRDILDVYERFNEWNLGDAPSNVIIDNANLDLTNPAFNPNATEVFNIGNNLTILNDGTLNIKATKSLIVGNSIISDTGLITLNSSSTRYPSLIAASVTGDGSFTYNRHVYNSIPGGGGNDLVSAPFTGQAFNEFAVLNPNIRTNTDETLYLFGPFEKSSGTYITYSVDETAPLVPGVGYRAATTDNGTLGFRGVMNTSPIDVPIEISGPQFEIWNLIGNPYPSYIRLVDFLSLNSAKFNTNRSGIYGYNGTSGGFEIWNDAYALLNPTAVITPGQGFLVASGSVSESVNFTPNMRTTGTSDDFIAGRQASESVAYLRLKATIDIKDYTTDFYFTDLASRGLNPGYDSGVFGSGVGSRGIYSELVEENVGIDMGIQTIGMSDLSTEVSIPVGIHAAQGQQVTVSMVDATLPEGINVFLEDNLTNVFTLLNTADYVFTPNTNLNSTGRFYLRFVDNSLSVTTNDLDRLQIHAIDRTLHVNGPLSATTSVSLYDIQGREVLSKGLESGSINNRIDVSSVSSGVYIVKVTNASQEKTKKVILK